MDFDEGPTGIPVLLVLAANRLIVEPLFSWIHPASMTGEVILSCEILT